MAGSQDEIDLEHNADLIPNTDVRIKRCSTCREPVKGHQGPTGKQCKVDIPGDVDADYEASGKDDDSESNTGTPDIGGVLVTQMASLNVNLDGMRQSQSLILNAVRTKTNNDRSFDMATPPTVNPQSSMTETRSGINEGKHVSLSLGGSISEKTQKNGSIW